MLLFVFLSCARTPEVRAAEPRSVFLDGYPHVRQEPDFCGEACLAMAMAGRGVPVDQDAVFDLTGLDPALGRGAWTRELVVAARALGFDPGETWTKVPAGDAAALQAQWQALLSDLRADVPSIVCMRFDEGGPEHFRLVLGYDAATDEVRYHDPALDDGADRRMSRARFLALWPLHYEVDTDTLVRLRLPPGVLVQPPVAPGVSEADLAQAVMAVQEKIGEGSAFTVVVEPPWVVVGDGSADEVRKRAEGTVAWATKQLRADYFPTDPSEPWTIWLFRDDESYTRHALAFFGDEPDTPYGYADGDERALVMNIGTGGGTLVHEMVHPYVAANLPGCPPWINEGLASLYEHVGEEGGHIWGYTNWRLGGLQRAIAADALPSLRGLTSAGAREFYGDDSGVNYAMARYLMQYLQEQGKLRAFVAALREGNAADPSGYQAMLDSLGVTDADAFLETWKAWAMALRRK